jgi:hypothetical protein
MGGIINNPPFQETFKTPSPTLLGTIVAIYEIGCCAGALLTAVVGERLGRRMSILLGAIVMLGGAGFQAGVSSAGPMIAARVISGLGMVSVHCLAGLTTGIHQLNCPRFAGGGFAKGNQRKIRLLPAFTSELRYLHRLLDRIRFYTDDWKQGLANPGRDAGDLHYPYHRPHISGTRISPMACCSWSSR